MSWLSKSIGIVLVILFLTTMVFAARTTVDASLDGNSVVYVYSGQTISASVDGTLTSGDDWEGTAWEINTSQSSFTCVNTPDHSSNGSYNEVFSITAPVTPGTYNTYFRISGNDNCTNQNGTTLTLSNAVIVVLPDASIEVPSTALQGSLWNIISMDCPDVGTSGDECQVDITGPVSSSFIESDNSPDPDSANLTQVLYAPGTYTYSISVCPTGAPGSCAAPTGTGTITILDDLNFTTTAATTGTIWLAFNSSGPTLTITGVAPTDTNTVEIVLNEKDDSTQIGATVNVVPDSNNYYNTSIDLSGVSPQIINVHATFVDASASTITSVSSLLEAYLLDAVDANVEVLQLQVSDLNTQIGYLEQDILDLNTQDQNFTAQLTDIYATLAEHDANIISLQTQINDLDQRVTDLNTQLQAEIVDLQSQIDSLEARVTDLENTVNAMNHGTITLAFDRAQSNGWLRVKGEAPVGTVSVTIDVLNADRDVMSGLTITDNSVNPANNEYGKTYTNVNDWNSEIYQIRATFYDGNGNTIGQNVFAQFYALSVLAAFQGFGFVENKTYEYILVLPSTESIRFSFGALTTGQYDFNLVLSDGTTTTNQVLVSSNLNKYDSQSFNTRFIVPGKGNYAANLVAYNQNTSETVVSDDFNVEIVDLFDALVADINIAAPAYNDNAFSAQANTFYTNNDFNLVASVGTTNLGSYCIVRLAGNDEDFLAVPSIANYMCSTMAFKAGMLGASEGLFGLTVESPVNNLAGADFNLGIDYTKPAFPDLNSEAVLPSIGAYSGMLHIDVNSWDTLSGIDTVLVEIIDKNTSSVVSSAYADYNAITGFWNHDFNTIFLGIPDGNYNIKATATDVAGNTDDRIVDPGVDNTKPVINSIVLSASPIVRGGTVTVDVNVSDNFSGVKEVSAVIVDSNANPVSILALSKESGTNLSGVWSADFNTDSTWLPGLYTVIVDANDYAIPSNSAITNTSDVNVLIGYDFNIATNVSATEPVVFSLDGNFRDDLGNVPTGIDANIILVTSSAVNDLNVVFDENGIYTIVTKSLSAGTYIIDLNYNTVDYNYTTRITLKVTSPAPATGGGGVSGGLLIVPSADTNVADINTPPTNNTNENTNTDNGTAEGTTNTSNAVTVPETPNGPTGLFGLGDFGNTLPLGVAVLVLIGGVWYFVFRKK